MDWSSEAAASMRDALSFPFPNDDQEEAERHLRLAAIKAQLAVAEEIRAFRELMGRSAT